MIKSERKREKDKELVKESEREREMGLNFRSKNDASKKRLKEKMGGSRVVSVWQKTQMKRN